MYLTNNAFSKVSRWKLVLTFKILIPYKIITVLQGMELYPRIGKNFDIKVFTNCRFGMMSWAVLAVTYCIKQVSSIRILFHTGQVSFVGWCTHWRPRGWLACILKSLAIVQSPTSSILICFNLLFMNPNCTKKIYTIENDFKTGSDHWPITFHHLQRLMVLWSVPDLTILSYFVSCVF